MSKVAGKELAHARSKANEANPNECGEVKVSVRWTRKVLEAS